MKSEIGTGMLIGFGLTVAVGIVIGVSVAVGYDLGVGAERRDAERAGAGRWVEAGGRRVFIYRTAEGK